MRRAACLAAIVSVLALAPLTASRAPFIETVRAVDLSGRTWDAARFQGRITVVDFWATWCAPCLVELPYLKRAAARYAPEEFQIVGVSVDVMDRRSLVSWLNRQNVTWPQVFDGRGLRGPIARMFGVEAVPATFLLDAEGRLVATNLRGDRLLNAIDVMVDDLRRSRSLP
jgi:thiol-disulfide isomerase/thioredoxin